MEWKDTITTNQGVGGELPPDRRRHANIPLRTPAILKAVPLTIATWNVLATAYIRPHFYPDVDPTHLAPAWRIPALARHARQLQADILCLQEVERATFEAISAILTPLGYTGFLQMKPHGRPDGCATFLRGLPAATQQNVELDHGHIAQIITLPQTIVIANTHLKWNPPGETFGEHQARQILENLPPSPLQIICGDCNAEPGSGPIKVFEDAGFTYPHRNAPTCNSNRRAKQIDFILTRGPASVTPVPPPPIDNDTPLPSADHPSDHLPLLAVVDPLPRST